MRADVTLAAPFLEDGQPGIEKRIVTDYFALVYSSVRHNRAAEYWVVLNPPVGGVRAVELQAPEPELGRPEAQAAYLGADFEVLSRLEVTHFERAPLEEALFLRGDSSGDGQLDLVDAIGLLRFLFERDETLPCLEAADANDDGQLNIADPIAVVSALFGRSALLPEPFPNCGSDATEDTLQCCSAPACPQVE